MVFTSHPILSLFILTSNSSVCVSPSSSFFVSVSVSQSSPCSQSSRCSSCLPSLPVFSVFPLFTCRFFESRPLHLSPPGRGVAPRFRREAPLVPPRPTAGGVEKSFTNTNFLSPAPCSPEPPPRTRAPHTPVVAPAPPSHGPAQPPPQPSFMHKKLIFVIILVAWRARRTRTDFYST